MKTNKTLLEKALEELKMWHEYDKEVNSDSIREETVELISEIEESLRG